MDFLFLYFHEIGKKINCVRWNWEFFECVMEIVFYECEYRASCKVCFDLCEICSSAGSSTTINKETKITTHATIFSHHIPIMFIGLSHANKKKRVE